MIEKPRYRIREYLGQLPPARQRAIKGALRFLARSALKILGALRVSLETLARLSGTDKIAEHDYIGAYRRFFSEYRNRPITLLEIGVGGYDSTDGGRSLDLWQAYFLRGTIVAIDVYDKTALSRGRVHVHQCSQVDRAALERLAKQYDGFDLIIDDGSHLNHHQIETFNILFPFMKENGVYVVEDVQTSYWPAYGGGSVGTPGHATSAVSFFRGLVDGLNHAEYLPSARTAPTLFQHSICAIYFEHNLIAIVKGDNSGRSNVDIGTCASDLENTLASPTGLLGSL
jgi:demethylmacrocin O-methyltransferase